MPVLTIRHKTEYRYAKPVQFGEHRVMLRPRDGHDLRVIDLRMVIEPEPVSLHWIHDLFGRRRFLLSVSIRRRRTSRPAAADRPAMRRSRRPHRGLGAAIRQNRRRHQ
jgi:hypothetical protein